MRPKGISTDWHCLTRILASSRRMDVDLLIYRVILPVLQVLVLVSFINSRAKAQAVSRTVMLQNGMQVILKENRSSPMIASFILVKAGSKYETDYNNGVTHLLEHLLFDGSRKFTREQINEGIKGHGGYINAFTRKEMTGYIVLMPKEEIDFGLQVQSEMLFNSIFPEEELPKERKVVNEEIRMGNDNPDNQVEDFFDFRVYSGTPYARPVIGFENIISSIPREEIIAYYRRFYVPNNMLALLIGDFDTEEMLKKFDQYFGQQPARPIESLPFFSLEDPKGQQVIRQELEVKTTYVNFSVPAPGYTDPDYYAFALLADLLSGGEASPLQKLLTGGADPLALSVTASLETQKEFTRLNIGITCDRPEKSEPVIEKVKTFLAGLPQQNFTVQELQAVVVSAKTQEYYLLEKPQYYAIMRAPLLVTTGHSFLESFVDRLAAVTPQMMVQALKRYFVNPRFIATVVTPVAEKKKETRAKASTVYKKEVLPNGLTVIIKSNPDSKVMAVNVLGKSRSAWEPDELAGITDFVHRMLDKGTSRSKEQIARVLQSIGAQLQTNDNPYVPYDDHYTTRYFSFVRFETIDEFADTGLAVLADMVLHPVFNAEEVEKTKKEVLDLLRREAKSPAASARDLFFKALFANGPYGKPVMGDSLTVVSFTPEKLKAYHQQYFSGGNLILTVCTGIDAEQMLAKVKKNFASLPRLTVSEPNVTAPILNKGLIEQEKPLKSEQVYIYLGCLLPGPGDIDAPALMVMNNILSARLGLNIREKQGLAYSIRSSATFERNFGWLITAMGTGKGNFELAHKGILEEIEKIKNEPVRDEELNKAKKTLWGLQLIADLARINQAFWMGVNEFLGRGFDFNQKMAEIIAPVTSADIQRVAQKYLDTHNYVLATAGIR